MRPTQPYTCIAIRKVLLKDLAVVNIEMDSCESAFSYLKQSKDENHS